MFNPEPKATLCVHGSHLKQFSYFNINDIHRSNKPKKIVITVHRLLHKLSELHNFGI